MWWLDLLTDHSFIISVHRGWKSCEDIWLPVVIFCGSRLSWIKWCLIQSRIHKGMDSWPRRVVTGVLLSQQLLSVVVCLKNRPTAHLKKALPVAWSGWIARFVCELSVTWAMNQDLSAPRTWLASYPSLQALRRGSLYSPHPRRSPDQRVVRKPLSPPSHVEWGNSFGHSPLLLRASTLLTRRATHPALAPPPPLWDWCLRMEREILFSS